MKKYTLRESIARAEHLHSTFARVIAGQRLGSCPVTGQELLSFAVVVVDRHSDNMISGNGVIASSINCIVLSDADAQEQVLELVSIYRSQIEKLESLKDGSWTDSANNKSIAALVKMIAQLEAIIEKEFPAPAETETETVETENGQLAFSLDVVSFGPLPKKARQAKKVVTAPAAKQLEFNFNAPSGAYYMETMIKGQIKIVHVNVAYVYPNGDILVASLEKEGPTAGKTLRIDGGLARTCLRKSKVQYKGGMSFSDLCTAIRI